MIIVILAIFVFLFTAVLGSVLLMAILTDGHTSKSAVLTHGLMALIGLFLLYIYMVLGHLQSLLITSFILFIIAALGGLTLFLLDLNGKRVPKLIVLLHPLLALTGLILLVINILP